MSLYRFAPCFGLGAVIALVHDVFVVLGALVITQIPFDLTVLAALLTVVGYSINDTTAGSTVVPSLRKRQVMSGGVTKVVRTTIITTAP